MTIVLPSAKDTSLPLARLIWIIKPAKWKPHSGVELRVTSFCRVILANCLSNLISDISFYFLFQFTETGVSSPEMEI
jgi:hypothetical protein